MTGGGFGGCVIALVPTDRVEVVGAAVREAVCSAGYQEPLITRTLAAQGAGAVTSAT
jgi:galactokinase